MSQSLAIICSDESRNGKSLFARLLCDFLSMSGEQSYRVFDTDFPNGDLSGFYPGNSQIVEFSKTAGQIQVFDTILSEPDFSYVIDLDQGLLRNFFKIFSDIGFDQEASAKGMTTSVYFMLDRKVSSVASALEIQKLCGRADFIPIRNESMGNVLAIPKAAGIYGSIVKAREILLPRLSIDALNYIDQPSFSFADFLTSNGENTPGEIRFEIWSFLESIYNQRQNSQSDGPVTL